MVTVLSNLIGDRVLSITIEFIIMYGRWNIDLMDISNIIIYMIIFLATITKNAQMLFSDCRWLWLPLSLSPH